MDPFFIRLESTAFSMWLRDAPTLLAFPTVLIAHTIGMGILAGVCGMVAMRLLGVAPAIPVTELRRFFPVLWFGLALNAVSGILLLVAYPTKALTNPLFYLKLALIAAGLAMLKPIRRRVWRDGPLAAGAPAPAAEPDDVSPALRRWAAASIACWIAAITAGRLLAYTYSRLTAIP